jgi:hypothetical protein
MTGPGPLTVATTGGSDVPLDVPDDDDASLDLSFGSADGAEGTRRTDELDVADLDGFPFAGDEDFDSEGLYAAGTGEEESDGGVPYEGPIPDDAADARSGAFEEPGADGGTGAPALSISDGEFDIATDDAPEPAVPVAVRRPSLWRRMRALALGAPRPVVAVTVSTTGGGPPLACDDLDQDGTPEPRLSWGSSNTSLTSSTRSECMPGPAAVGSTEHADLLPTAVGAQHPGGSAGDDEDADDGSMPGLLDDSPRHVTTRPT